MKNSIYSKIYQDFLRKVRQGLLKPGDVIPSTRDYAKLYKCHRFTVMRVYQDLAAEGWLESYERKRYQVSIRIPVTASLKSTYRLAKVNFLKTAKPVPAVDLEKGQHRLEFWGGQPDLRLFPIDEYRRTLSTALRRTRASELNYGFTMGLERCLKEVSEYLRKSRSLHKKEFMMTHGSQEALLLAFQAFLNPGDKIAIERKGYPPAWRLFESLGAKLIPIDVDIEGLKTDALEKVMKTQKIKMIYLTPLHQYPTTVTLSPRRRQKLIELAERHRVPLLEDDYDHEFHYIGPPPPPLSSETDMGIYICSFSKVLFPGARLGAIGCEPEIMKYLVYQKHLASRQTDCVSQIGLSAWLRDGGFERHLRRMQRTYETRYLFMLDRLSKMKSAVDLDWQIPTGGMSIWLNLFQDSKKIAEAAQKKGVFFQHEETMDYRGHAGTHLRLGFAGVNEKEIAEGLDILTSLLRR